MNATQLEIPGSWPAALPRNDGVCEAVIVRSLRHNRTIKLNRSVSVRGEPRFGAAAADPGIGPVGDLALVGFDIRAPGAGRQRLALVDDVELAVGLDLADHDRLWP